MSGPALTLPPEPVPPSRLPTVLFLVGFIALGAVFYAFPQFDLATSRALTDGNGVFPLQHDPWLTAVNRSITWGARLLAAGLILGLLLSWLPRRFAAQPLSWLRQQRRVLWFVLLALALGPGLLVNSLLKEYSGRARPSTITEFGGTQRFTRAFVFSDQCNRNCAFVSGHAAIAAFPVVGYFIARRRRTRLLWLGGGLAFGFTIGFGRMVTGSHFLSDVVIAIFLTYLVAAACAAWLLRPVPSKVEHTG